MPEPSPSTYSPVVDPRDFASVPRGLGPNDELHVPVLPPRGRLRPPSWMRQLGEQHRLVLSFCTSDRQLLRWDPDPGSAERFVASVAPEAALTLDVPFYRFMSDPTRERALSRSVSAIHRAMRSWEPRGIEVIPLVKGLTLHEWAPQLQTAAELGLSRVAQYVREQRLENDEAAIGSFVRHARQAGLRPMLVGCFSPRSSWGPLDAAALHHYVLARRRRLLGRSGHHAPVGPGTYSELLGRFLLPRDLAALVEHNFRRARMLFGGSLPLSRFGFDFN
jgi:hypothetical protein